VTVEQVVECHVATAAAAAASPVKKAPRVWLLGLKLGGKPHGKTCGKVGVLFCPIHNNIQQLVPSLGFPLYLLDSGTNFLLPNMLGHGRKSPRAKA